MQRPATLGDAEADGAYHVWALRGADGGSQGLEFARAKIGETDSVLVHAAPSVLDVEVFVNGERLIAIGTDLRASEDTPMNRLTIDGTRVVREAIWPSEEDRGAIVLLPGGEAGELESWNTDQARRPVGLVGAVPRRRRVGPAAIRV
jgi:hypothetical protein